MSSSVDKREAVSRSDLKVLPSLSFVCWEEPQSMRKLSGGENAAAGGEEEGGEKSMALAMLRLNNKKKEMKKNEREEMG